MRDFVPVVILFINGGITGVLFWLKTSVWLVVCVSDWIVTIFWTVFTTAFAPLFSSTFNRLSKALIHVMNTTNKYDNDLYKLIIT